MSISPSFSPLQASGNQEAAVLPPMVPGSSMLLPPPLHEFTFPSCAGRPGNRQSRLALPGLPLGILWSLCSTVYRVWFLLPSLRNSAPALRELPLSPSSSPASPRFLRESVHHSGDPCRLRPQGVTPSAPLFIRQCAPTTSLSSHAHLSCPVHPGSPSYTP